MTVQASLSRTWWEAQIVGFLMQRLISYILVPAAVKLDHYAMVLIDGGTSERQVYNLKDGTQKNNVLTIHINSTLVSFGDVTFDILNFFDKTQGISCEGRVNDVCGLRCKGTEVIRY